MFNFAAHLYWLDCARRFYGSACCVSNSPADSARNKRVSFQCLTTAVYIITMKDQIREYNI